MCARGFFVFIFVIYTGSVPAKKQESHLARFLQDGCLLLVPGFCENLDKFFASGSVSRCRIITANPAMGNVLLYRFV